MKKIVGNVLIFISVLWTVWILDTLTPLNLNQLGIRPRTVHGLIGIVLSPLLHRNMFHLISNTIPCFVLLVTLYVFYPKKATFVLVLSVLIGGGLVWLFGRSAIHIGISGLIYSIASYLIMAGFYSGKMKALLVSVAVIALYGGLIWGVFPGKYWISWEGHLFGVVAGVLLASVFNKKKAVSES